MMQRRHGWLVIGSVVALGSLLAGPVVAEHLPGVAQLVSKTATDGPANDANWFPSVSGDGTRIAYYSDATNIVAGDTNEARDVFLYDTVAGTTTLVSRGLDDQPANSSSWDPAISGDGTVITYTSNASNLAPGDDNTTDVFVYDTTTDTTTLVSRNSHGDAANGTSHWPVVSADGTKIAYTSAASDIVSGDTNERDDIFVFDIATATTILVSKDPSGAPTTDFSFASAISEDGTKIAYPLGPFDLFPGTYSVFLYDATKDATTLISKNRKGEPSNGDSGGLSISADGTKIAFGSDSSDIVGSDTNNTWDIFLYDVDTDTTTLVSKNSEGGATNDASNDPAISADGTTIAYASHASNIVSGDTNGGPDIFVYDTITDLTKLVSADSAGGPANGESGAPAISADGNRVAYQSGATDVVSGDTNNTRDVFLWSTNRAPVVDPMTASVSEEAPVGTAFATVAATDRDRDALSHAITAGNGAGLFAIDAATGLLSTIGPLDYETTSRYVLTVSVSDGSHSVDVTVTVNVTDVGGPLDTNSFDDDDGSIFENDIEWLAAAGITKGCGDRRFCPDDNVTRGEMAAFLNRALGLPATATDFFTDDDGTLFENDINELAASAITKGCSPDSYCPDSFVTRGQMAAFLNRALGLPATATDFFTDDDGTLFENDINELAASGITKGCATDSFCADGLVTRGQIAAFLHRALK